MSYDIADPKRLRRMLKLMRNWGDHLQLSVFHCELSPDEIIRIETEITSVINHSEDQVLIIYLGPAEGRAESSMKACGRPLLVHGREATVV